MGMDLKTNKRNILGILIITLIFGIFSIISFLRMSDHSQEKEDLVKKDYVLMLEQELGIKFESDNDFINFATINNDFIVEPTKYQNYFKPCFDFVIKEDGVEITNSLAKDFYDMGLEVGMKITKVNGETLSGKGYFEILEKMYAKNYEEEKKFTLSNNQEINYKYIGYDNRYNFDEENKILYLYDLDIVNQENIYEFYNLGCDNVIGISALHGVGVGDLLDEVIALGNAGADLSDFEVSGAYDATQNFKENVEIFL